MVAHQLASQQQSIQALQTIIQESNTRMEQRLTEALSQFNFLRHIMPLFAPTPATAITPEDAMTMDLPHPPAAVYMLGAEQKSPEAGAHSPLAAPQHTQPPHTSLASGPNCQWTGCSLTIGQGGSVTNMGCNAPPTPAVHPPHYSAAATTSSLPSPHQ
jgi:hypothetical protein